MTPHASKRLQAFARTPLGRRVRDLPIAYFHATMLDSARIPRSGGALLVGNHAMGGLDGFVLGSLVQKETGRNVRFLGERNLWRIPVVRDLLDAVGAVPGTPDHAIELLRAGELCAVYPGGIDDSWKLTATERYRLQWGTRAGFARVALQAGVPIVPVAALGIDEMYDVVMREPFLGRALLGSPRYDLPLALGVYGTIVPRRVPQQYLVQPAIATEGHAGDAADVERIRAATYASLDSVLSRARGA